MRAWRHILGGLLLWAVHFGAVYVITSVFLTSPTSRILVALVTLVCLGAVAVFLRHACTDRAPDDDDARWQRKIAILTSIAASIAIVWQGLPALLV